MTLQHICLLVGAAALVSCATACHKPSVSRPPPDQTGRYILVPATVENISQGKVVGQSPRLFKIDTATGKIWQFQTSSDGRVEIDGWLDVSDDLVTAISKFARSQTLASPSPSSEIINQQR
jgi:hypothetical protein